jgi:CheY-like chemotaxis protein
VRLLWVDDDGPNRFRYEEAVLKEDRRCAVDWASNVEHALSLLRTEAFDAIVLDQMLPLTEHSTASDYWGGCVVLHWLKLSSYPATAPPTLQPALFRAPPLPANVAAPVCFVSAFSDDDVHRELLRADRTLPIFAKPLDLDLLEGFLDGARDSEPADAE